MSIKIMSAVWRTRCQTHTAKLVLLALADNANDEGLCWPSIATLAAKCDLSQQGVRNQLQTLKACHLLEFAHSKGRVNNRYQLTLHVVEGSTLNAVDGQRGGRSTRLRVQPSTPLAPTLHAVDPNHHEPSVEPSLRARATLELQARLREAFNRPSSAPWSYLEESTLAALVRERPDAASELEMMLAFRKRMKPEDHRYFPQSLSKFLDKWTETLDRANNGHLPKRPDYDTQDDKRVARLYQDGKRLLQTLRETSQPGS